MTNIYTSVDQLPINLCAEQVAQVLGIPSHIRVMGLMPMGYAADDAEPLYLHSQYRDMEDMVQLI